MHNPQANIENKLVQNQMIKNLISSKLSLNLIFLNYNFNIYTKIDNVSYTLLEYVFNR